MREIASSTNPRVKVLRAIAGSRGITRHGRALVCGRRLVEEVLARQPRRVESLVYPGAAASADDPLSDLAAEILALPPSLYRELDPIGAEPPLAVVRVEEPPPWDPASERSGPTLLLPLGTPENLGAALRTAAAFAVARVVLLAEAAHPFLPRAIRAAAGTCFELELRTGPPLASLVAAPPPGLDLLALDRDGEPLSGVVPSADCALLVGEEGEGVPEGGGLRRVAIPTSERVESLNAAVAVGIALWELVGRRGAR